jgi:hypothetical protein
VNDRRRRGGDRYLAGELRARPDPTFVVGKAEEIRGCGGQGDVGKSAVELPHHDGGSDAGQESDQQCEATCLRGRPPMPTVRHGYGDGSRQPKHEEAERPTADERHGDHERRRHPLPTVPATSDK